MAILILLVLLFVSISLIFSLPLSFPKVKLSPSQLSIYYGAPGSGKTTYASWLAKKYMACGYKVYSNVPIKGCYQISKEDLGHFEISDGLLIYDEVGIDYNNRNTSAFGKGADSKLELEWWKKHRHEGVEVCIFSQGFDDMDKKLRTLATKMYLIQKPLFLPYFIACRRIKKKPDIDELTHTPTDFYYFVPFLCHRIFAPSVWNMFDSFEKMGLPKKEFKIF